MASSVTVSSFASAEPSNETPLTLNGGAIGPLFARRDFKNFWNSSHVSPRGMKSGFPSGPITWTTSSAPGFTPRAGGLLDGEEGAADFGAGVSFGWSLAGGLVDG